MKVRSCLVLCVIFCSREFVVLYTKMSRVATNSTKQQDTKTQHETALIQDPDGPVSKRDHD